MNSRRLAKVAQAILETVSSTVLFGLKDPRVKNVTVLRVEPSRDMRTAKVYVSVMGNEKTQSLSMHGLNSVRGFLQSKIADRLQTQYTPVLTFVLDPGIKHSFEASRLLHEVLPGEDSDAPPDESLENADDSSEDFSPSDQSGGEPRSGLSDLRNVAHPSGSSEDQQPP